MANSFSGTWSFYNSGYNDGCYVKRREKLTIKVDGNGPIGPILVDAHAKGDVRGYVTNPHVDFEGTEQGKLRVYQAVGTEGFVTN